MIDLVLKLELLSDTLVGSGEGWGAAIDSDIVFDEFGLPIIPAKRIKGCLRESAMELVEMFNKSQIKFALPEDIDTLFGKTQQTQAGLLSFSNCVLEKYELNRKYLAWLTKNYPCYFSKEMILSTFSVTRQQTAIDINGIAKDHSLRTKRALSKRYVFLGKIRYPDEIDERLLVFLGLIIRNFRYMGTDRNRGLGFIRCDLLNEKEEAQIEKNLNYFENKLKEV